MSRILFVGDLNSYGRSYRRYLTLQRLGHDVDAISHTPVSQSNKIESPSLLYKITWKLGYPIDPTQANSKIKEALKSKRYDIVWLEKGNTILPTTLKFIKKINPSVSLISCSEDDMYVRHGSSFWYRYGIKYYDCIFTTKYYNLNELKLFGAKKTSLFYDSFDELIHKKWVLSDSEMKKYKCDVSAIGAYELERAESLLFLARNDIKVSVWGGNWEGLKNIHPNLLVHDEFLFGVEYAKAICASKININFLRKINRDEITSRSMEIPACGSFMLAERTARHIQAFKEGVEADFFSSDKELLSKIKFYLFNQQLRQKIAVRGMRRCFYSGYSMSNQLQIMLNQILN